MPPTRDRPSPSPTPGGFEEPPDEARSALREADEKEGRHAITRAGLVHLEEGETMRKAMCLQGPATMLLGAALTASAALAIHAQPARAAQFYIDQVAWTAAAGGDVATLELLVASEVAKADEVASAPSDGEFINTSSLTFQGTATGLSQQFQLNLLESTGFEFRTSGNQPGLEPNGNTLEDFEQQFETGVFALAMFVSEQQRDATAWTLYDADDDVIESFSLPDQATSEFYGVVSDTRILRAEVIHPDSPTDNLGIGTHYFAEVPEPASLPILVLGSLAAASIGCRRR